MSTTDQWHVRVHQSAVDGRWFATAHSGEQVGSTAVGTPRWRHWAYTGRHPTTLGALKAIDALLRTL